MTGFAVYYRRLDNREIAGRRFQAVDASFATADEARTHAVRMNSKAFSPFYFWIVEVGI